MLPHEVASTGARIILGNTFHLYLRPGHKLIETLGGLHRFAGWEHSILTDSGGFQVFSLRQLRSISEAGVSFASPFDGSRHELTPELVVEIQEALGSDIAMSFDECPPADSDLAYVVSSMERTTRWLDRCISARQKPARTSLFGIVQGGRFLDLRERHVRTLMERDLDGYAIGGVAIGESREEMMRVVRATAPMLPSGKPRYLMGVGYPIDLVEAVALGVDMFDCVIPTRAGRTGRVFTRDGYYSIKQSRNREDSGPLDPECACPTCAIFSRAYLRHLFVAGEITAHRLLTMHNLWFFQDHMRRIRAAIASGTLSALVEEVRARQRSPSEGAGPELGEGALVDQSSSRRGL